MKIIHSENFYRIVEVIVLDYNLDDLKGDCYKPEYSDGSYTNEELKVLEVDFEERVFDNGVFGYVLEKWNSNINKGWEHVDSCYGFIGRHEFENHYIVDELKESITNEENKL